MTTNNIDPGYGWRVVDFEREKPSEGMSAYVDGRWVHCRCSILGLIKDNPHRIKVDPNSDCPEEIWEIVPEGEKFAHGYGWEFFAHGLWYPFGSPDYGFTAREWVAKNPHIRAFRRKKQVKESKLEPTILGRHPTPWESRWTPEYEREPSGPNQGPNDAGRIMDANGSYLPFRGSKSASETIVEFVNALARERDRLQREAASRANRCEELRNRNNNLTHDSQTERARLTDRIEELEAEITRLTPRWVSVDEELPEDGELYRVIPWEGASTLDFWYENERWWEDYSKAQEMQTPLMWLKRPTDPEPPKEPVWCPHMTRHGTEWLFQTLANGAVNATGDKFCRECGAPRPEKGGA